MGPEGCPVLGATCGVQSGLDGYVEGPGYRMAGIMSAIYNHPHPRYLRVSQIAVFRVRTRQTLLIEYTGNEQPDLMY